MSDEMAVGDNTTSDESKVNSNEAVEEKEDSKDEVSLDPPGEPSTDKTEAAAVPEDVPKLENVKDESPDIEDKKVDCPEVKEQPDEMRGVKRRASMAFSDNGDGDFKGFIEPNEKDLTGKYSRILEHLEMDLLESNKDFVPLRTLRVNLTSLQANKKTKQDSDGSRPSSALSTKSDGEWTEMYGSSAVRGRRSTTEMSSPLLRVPLERGWRRELVYRAALDAHSRRNADIYYYTPQGKKLRSTREISENLAGTGLTLENFSFFKEPLGVDDPEKETIRDAKLIRRVESPVLAPAPTVVEGKRTPKPKPPKGASPEPATPKSPPVKLKVKSLGSRLSNNGTPPAGNVPKQPRRVQSQPQPATPTAATNATVTPATATTATAADNNNSAAWKKPRAGAQAPLPPPLPLPQPPQPPPPLQSRPPVIRTDQVLQSPRQLVQPCSMACGRGTVPSLACTVCLCLYHPACAGYAPDPFLCTNCRKLSSPPLEPPPLTHKSGTTAVAGAAAGGGVNAVAGVGSGAAAVVSAAAATAVTSGPRRIPTPQPVPKQRNDKRVLLRMKVAGGAADGTRVWAVATPSTGGTVVGAPTGGAGTTAPPPANTTSTVRPTLPQSLAVLNGRRFIIVPRSLVQTDRS